MLNYCGLHDDNRVQKLCTKTQLFPHNTQSFLCVLLSRIISTTLFTHNPHYMHTLCVQFLSVSRPFSTVYTGPTITTTYILSKKGYY